MPSKQAEFAGGWKVLAACALGAGAGVAAIAFYSLGAFIEPLGREFGWSRAQVTGAAAFLSIGFVVMGVPVGSAADRFGARNVALVSQGLLVFALAALSLITAQVWTLYAGYFLLAVLGAGTLPITWTRTITGWFVKGRGLALGLSLIGTGLLGMLLPSYVTWLDQHVGWRGAYLGLAVLPLLGMPLALRYFHESRDRAANAATSGGLPPAEWGYGLGAVMKTRRFWQMSIAFALAAAAIGAINVHTFPLLTDRGIDRGTAAALAGLVGLTVTAGRLVTGYFLDIFPAAKVAFVMLAAPALGCGVLVVAGDNLWLCSMSIVLVGFVAGAEHDIVAYLTARYFGRRHFGAVFGLFYALYTLGSGLSPALAGKVFDVTGSYDLALYAGVPIFLVAAVLAGTLGAYPIQDSETCVDSVVAPAT